MQTGESFFEVASLEIVTEIPLLVLFFSRHMIISPRKIRKVTAANDPMRGHFIFSKSDVDPGREVGLVSILLLTKIVELVFIFSSSKCC